MGAYGEIWAHMMATYDALMSAYGCIWMHMGALMVAYDEM